MGLTKVTWSVKKKFTQKRKKKPCRDVFNNTILFHQRTQSKVQTRNIFFFFDAPVWKVLLIVPHPFSKPGNWFQNCDHMQRSKALTGMRCTQQCVCQSQGGWKLKTGITMILSHHVESKKKRVKSSEGARTFCPNPICFPTLTASPYQYIYPSKQIKWCLQIRTLLQLDDLIKISFIISSNTKTSEHTHVKKCLSPQRHKHKATSGEIAKSKLWKSVKWGQQSRRQLQMRRSKMHVSNSFITEANNLRCSKFH